MGAVTTTDGTEIFYKDWAQVSRSCSATVGRCPAMTGTCRYCSSYRTRNGTRVAAPQPDGTGRRCALELWGATQ
jgi:hypothetical protein